MDDVDRQEALDRFYAQHGPCCAGCDWWGSLNSHVGECSKSAPVSGSDRIAMIGMSNVSMPIGAGHVFTKHDHRCGDFRDEFDWASLPLAYRKRCGLLDIHHG